MNEGSFDVPPINDEGQENVSQSSVVGSKTENPAMLEVFDSAPRR